MSVFFYGCVTLDGYLADRNHGLDWLHQSGTVEETGYEAFYRQMDVTIMGRRTYREIEVLENPAALYPTTENYVFTHAGCHFHYDLQGREWPGWACETGLVLASLGNFSRLTNVRMAVVSDPRVTNTRKVAGTRIVQEMNQQVWEDDLAV